MTHRRKLPRKRVCVTHKLKIAGNSLFLSIGHYEDGKPGEIFLDMMKEGSSVSGLLNGIAILASLFLQYGGTVDRLVQQFADTKFQPADHNHSSIFDAIASVLEAEYLTKKEIA